MDFANRHKVEEHLAAISEGGALVEIGGGYGHGALALAKGTGLGRNLPVYVIDPYEPYKDELGAEYGPETKHAFCQTLQDAGVSEFVTLVEQRAEDAVVGWDRSIAVLWLDLSMPYEPLKRIFDLWEPHVIEGGHVGITGLEYENLGTRRVAEEAGGYEHVFTEQGKVAVLRKRQLRRAVFYICSDRDSGRYVREAAESARSVREHLGLATICYVAGNCQERDAFTEVKTLHRTQHRFWYLSSTRYFNRAVFDLKDRYEQLLYLDTDTCVCCPCDDIFTLLERFDMTLGLSPQREAIPSASGVPASFSTRQIGVIAFRNTQLVRDFLGDWLDRYNAHAGLYDNNDQAPLRDTLYENDSIRWVTLPPEYCLRFDFGAWVVGRVRILHGRRGGVSTDRVSLSTVCEEINQTPRMRIWQHGLLPGQEP